MKHIASKILIGLAAIGLCSCDDDLNNDEFSDLLGEQFNQEMKWNPDSLALSRANWNPTTLKGGATIGKASLNILGSNQVITKISYTTSMFVTRVANNPDNANLGTAANSEGEAIFAVNGASADFLMVDGAVIIDKRQGGDNTPILAINEREGEEKSDIIMSSPAAYDILKGQYTTVLAGGDMLVNYGEEIEQPESQRASRTIIGTTAKGDMLIMVIDSNSGDGTTLAESAFIARVSGMTNAMCLNNDAAVWSGGDESAPGAETVVYGIRNIPFASGEGTPNNPYVITTARHLGNMRSALVANGTLYFELGADIDMNRMDWTPLNYADPYHFRIVFDGKGHTISNFYCDFPKYPSFFGVLYGECRNVKFENASVYQNNDGTCLGVVTGYLGTGGKPGVVDQVALVNCTVATGPDNAPQMGGIAGQFGEGSISNCYAENITLKREKIAVNTGAGGIIGRVRNKTTVENCWASGNINVIKMDNAGGIWGRAEDNSGWTLRNNIGWMTNITAAWASNRVGGRTLMKTGNNSLGDNYGWTGTGLVLFENDTPSPAYDENYKGSMQDRSIAGADATDIIEAAKALGWDESVWDLSGSMPRLKWEN